MDSLVPAFTASVAGGGGQLVETAVDDSGSGSEARTYKHARGRKSAAIQAVSIVSDWTNAVPSGVRGNNRESSNGRAAREASSRAAVRTRCTA